MTSYILLEGGTDKLLAENGDFLVLEDHVAGGGTAVLLAIGAATAGVGEATRSGSLVAALAFHDSALTQHNASATTSTHVGVFPRSQITGSSDISASPGSFVGVFMVPVASHIVPATIPSPIGVWIASSVPAQAGYVLGRIILTIPRHVMEHSI